MPPSLSAFFSPDDPLALLAQVAWFFQLALIVHVYRTGRPYWWIYILLAAPGIGGLAYVLLEMAPEWSTNGGGFWKPRRLRIRDLRQELEESDVVKTRLALADELLATGAAEEACAVAEEAARGVFKDDPHTLAAVARFQLEARPPAEALAMLERVDVHRDKMLALDVAMLRGRALFALGRHAEAQAEIRTIQDRYSSEEPRYYLALSLCATGRQAEAKALLEDIVKKFRRASRAWRRSERQWFRLAVGSLKEMKG